jgi:PAS domain S-box-containing protein
MLHFNEANGLVGDEVNRGALMKASDGRIFIGTQKGLSVFSPQETVAAFGAPKAVIRSANLGGEDALNQSLSVSFAQNSLQVDFLTPGFDESRELWVHYRLVNRGDEPWQIIKGPRNSQLFFNTIPFGKHYLELKASYEGEVFSEVVRTPVFEVLPPFYLRPLFLIFAVLVLIGIGFLVGQWIRQLQKLGLLQSAVDKESKSKILAEKQFKNVWSSSQDGMILSLGGKVILTVNPAFAKVIGESVLELENKPVASLFADPETNMGYIEELVKNLKNLPGRGVTMEIPVAWKSTTLDMEMYTVMLDDNFNGEELILSVFKDLTAQKATENRLKEAKEKAEEANRFKSSLLSNLSHEVRTPLNGIIGGTEHIMMTRSNDPELLDQLEIILQSGERLLDTINSLLDLAKIEANKMPVNYAETWVHSFLILVLRPLEGAASRKGLKLVRKFHGEDFLAHLDRRFVEMILNNLVSNAVKYSEEGEIEIELEKVEDRLILQVIDSGVGMSEDFKQKMFEPFEQESHGNERLFEGTGLGLNITKNLVHLLGGEIQVWSAKKEGTRVRVEIPLPQS